MAWSWRTQCRKGPVAGVDGGLPTKKRGDPQKRSFLLPLSGSFALLFFASASQKKRSADKAKQKAWEGKVWVLVWQLLPRGWYGHSQSPEEKGVEG